MTRRPFVSLVGAGPGDPELITVRGLDRIKTADVIVHDYLVDERLVHMARDDAEIVYVGKRGGHHHRTQDQINDILLERARANGGQFVVRLKGGDPFVFGRGGEEALVLAREGIPFEVVPGVSSGHAVPAAAGIPVTQRGLATSVTFVTGHEDPTKPAEDVDWEKLATATDTLCIFMGMKNLGRIATSLIRGGRPADTPVALIRWGTTPRQEVLVTTLAEAVERSAEAGFAPPAIMVVGDVVALREELGRGTLSSTRTATSNLQ